MYMDLILTEFIRKHDGHSKNTEIFQQDGASPHYS